MNTLMNDRARIYEAMALRNEQAAFKAATLLQYFRYSRMQKRYEMLMCREMLRVANKKGADARRLVLSFQATCCSAYKRYDRLYSRAIEGQVGYAFQC